MGSAPTAAKPIDDSELDGLLQPLIHYQSLVLAVSGGPDSMALMLLAERFRDRLPPIHVVTVDHRLRPESTGEAAWVAVKAAELGLPHSTLIWDAPRPASGLMAAAREARYRLLADFARRNLTGSSDLPAAVVTAHTEDDQAETLLMRLARGSGLEGLHAIVPVRRLEDARVVLVRPLLAVSKARLIATLVASGCSWITDPSNDCADFERVRLRQSAEMFASLGLTSERLALSARRLTRANEVICHAVADFCQREVDLNGGAFALISRQAYAHAECEIQIRALARILRAFGGCAQEARLSQVEDLALRLSRGERIAVTLGGTIVSAGERGIRIYREPGRGLGEDLALHAGACEVWDERFRVSLAAPYPEKVTVRALGHAAYATIERAHLMARKVPARAAVGLPSFWVGSRLIGVPQLDVLVGGDTSNAQLCRSEFIGWERLPC